MGEALPLRSSCVCMRAQLHTLRKRSLQLISAACARIH